MGFSRLQLKKDKIPSISNHTPINGKGHKRKTTEENTRLAKQSWSSRVLENRPALEVKGFL